MGSMETGLARDEPLVGGFAPSDSAGDETPRTRFRRYFELPSFYLALAGLAATCVLLGVAIGLVLSHSSPSSDSGGSGDDTTYFPMCRDADPVSERRGGPPGPIQVPDGKLLVLWFSDVHLNPKYLLHAPATGGTGTNCHCESISEACPATGPAHDGRLGCDPPISLLHQALHALRNITSDPHLVIVTGDYVAHQSPFFPRNEEVVTETIGRVTTTIASAFPGAPSAWLAPALGNDDFYPDYFLNTSKVPNPHLERIASNWTSILPPGSPERATFVRHGYYRRDATASLSILVLQTMLYSVKNNGLSKRAGPDPGGQFAWIRAQLDAARAGGRRVIIMSHIPPITDDFNPKFMWRPEYQHTMLQLLGEYSDVVSGSLFGHVHRNLIAPLDAVLPAASPLPVPVLTLDAVSPVYENNPGVAAFVLDEASGEIEDLAVFASDLDGDHPPGHDSPWRCAYSTRHAFGMRAVTGKAAAAFRSRVQTDGALCKAYLRTTSVRESKLSTLCSEACQARKLCLLQSPEPDDVKKCVAAGASCPA